MAVRHRDVVLAHLKELGLRLNVRKVYFSSTDYPLIWAWCGIRPRCRHVCPLLGSSQSSRQSRVREGRSLTVKRFQKLLGLMSAASNVITFGLLYMRPLQWWLKTKGFSQRGKPTLHDQGHAAMPTCLRHVEETFGFCLKAWCWELLVASLSPWGVKQIWRVRARRWIRWNSSDNRTVPSGYLWLIQLHSSNSTLKVYLAAIMAYQAPLGGLPVGKPV